MIYIIIIFILGFAILFHELGHLVVAKWRHIPVARFSVGFGKKLWGFSKGETEYRLSMIPIGGYVMLKIENEEDYWRFPTFHILLFLLGGIIANILISILCLSIRNGLIEGISFSTIITAPIIQMSTLFRDILFYLPELFKKPEEMSGIVGIVAMGGKHIGFNTIQILEFSFFLNLNFAILNLLPIPPLDGGKIFLCLAQKIYKPLRKLQIPLAILGWLFIIALIIYVTIHDIRRWVLGV